MASSSTSSSKTTHIERTSTEPRNQSLHPVTISSIKNINPTIRTYRLSTTHPITFLPGQWLDVHVPASPKPGGFTITSSPNQATGLEPYLTLAVQRSSEPVAKWLWQDRDTILGQEIQIRVGGSFTWPPAVKGVNRAIFIAGGVGINPLISMVRHLDASGEMLDSVDLVYSTKAPEGQMDRGRILFLDDLMRIEERWKGKFRLHLFVTGKIDEDRDSFRAFEHRRLNHEDIQSIIHPEKENDVAYICGPPPLTDEYVAFLLDKVGMTTDRVLYEKWW